MSKSDANMNVGVQSGATSHVVTATSLLIDGSIEVFESHAKSIMERLEEHNEAALLYKFDEMLPDETLFAHVQQYVTSGSQVGPWVSSSLLTCTDAVLKLYGFPNLSAARDHMSKWWGGSSVSYPALGHMPMTSNTVRPFTEWESHIKDLLAGAVTPHNLPGLNINHGRFEPWSVAIQPVIIVSDDKKTRWWGMIRQGWPAPAAQQSEWALQNFQLVRNTPSPMTVMSSSSGDVLYQNGASIQLYGNRSLFFSDPIYQPALNLLANGQGSLVNSSSDDLHSTTADEDGLNFLQLLLLSCDTDVKERLEEIRASQQSLFVQVKIVSKRLRSWMNFPAGRECYYDITIHCSCEPNTMHKTFIIIQTDVTETELASRAIKQANAELAEERERIHALLRRQYELIHIMRSETTAIGQSDDSFTEKINFLRGAIAKDAEGSDILAQAEDISLGDILGRGNFGAVYLGEWRGTTVAVKRMVLPAAMTNSERAHQMAVMEVGISSSMSHPHLVQTYTYSIRPIQDKNSGGSQSTVTGHELRLVMEYCDRGSLGGLLKDYGGFKDDQCLLDYAAVLETAADIAKGMIHLHKNNICHNDLKANNVMFKSEGNDGRGVRAKVVDFGLSIKLDSSATHLSNAFQGTMTHMAPEVMMEGKQSKAADVYSFGMTLWELFTGGSPYKGLPPAALSQVVVFQQKRPAWPESTPLEFKSLAEECWQPNPNARPPFEYILERLTRMRSVIKEESKPLDAILARSPLPEVSGFNPPLLSKADLAEGSSSFEWLPTIMEHGMDPCLDPKPLERKTSTSKGKSFSTSNLVVIGSIGSTEATNKLSLVNQSIKPNDLAIPTSSNLTLGMLGQLQAASANNKMLSPSGRHGSDVGRIEPKSSSARGTSKNSCKLDTIELKEVQSEVSMILGREQQRRNLGFSQNSKSPPSSSGSQIYRPPGASSSPNNRQGRSSELFKTKAFLTTSHENSCHEIEETVINSGTILSPKSKSFPRQVVMSLEEGGSVSTGTGMPSLRSGLGGNSDPTNFVGKPDTLFELRAFGQADAVNQQSGVISVTSPAGLAALAMETTMVKQRQAQQAIPFESATCTAAHADVSKDSKKSKSLFQKLVKAFK